jgi:hypothetical protein
MFLKNYTSNVPVSDSIARIERVLITCGVAAIGKEYGPSGEMVALNFEIAFEPGKSPVKVRLPADKDACLVSLWNDYCGVDGACSHDKTRANSSHKKKRRGEFAQQAERTAWKLMVDWVEVQMSMIQMKQAETLQVFLPYITCNGETFYQRLKGQGYRALLAPPSSANS